MGQAVIRCILESDRAALACALVHPASNLAGEALARVHGDGAPDLDFANSLDPDIAADVLVDFSAVNAFDAVLALALERRLGFVSGTTGLSAEQFAALDRAARSIPVLWASNFSLGIAMLAGLARRVAESLPEWDCELLEMHHARKQDAPSGTALTLGEAVAQGRRIALDEHARFERHGQVGARPPGEIGFATLRGGDVVGEHTLIFASAGERIELIHRATRRDIFARGALTAAIWLAGRKPGRYRFDDVLDKSEG
jgi:4-hydroxy-tetrahydrodipicolinate reductase